MWMLLVETNVLMDTASPVVRTGEAYFFRLFLFLSRKASNDTTKLPKAISSPKTLMIIVRISKAVICVTSFLCTLENQEYSQEIATLSWVLSVPRF